MKKVIKVGNTEWKHEPKTFETAYVSPLGTVMGLSRDGTAIQAITDTKAYQGSSEEFVFFLNEDDGLVFRSESETVIDTEYPTKNGHWLCLAYITESPDEDGKPLDYRFIDPEHRVVAHGQTSVENGNAVIAEFNEFANEFGLSKVEDFKD
jgi:hypothetical protein